MLLYYVTATGSDVLIAFVPAHRGVFLEKGPRFQFLAYDAVPPQSRKLKIDFPRFHNAILQL